jgi:hypothetical protein
MWALSFGIAQGDNPGVTPLYITSSEAIIITLMCHKCKIKVHTPMIFENRF